MKYLVMILAGLFLSCHSQGGSGHAHDAAGNHIQETTEIPRLDHTIWTGKTELFVEFPALITGKQSRFAAHFTVLDKHQAVREGSVTVSLIKGNSGIRQTVDAPSSPGIFSPVLQPEAAGIYQLVFDLKTNGYSDKIVIDDVEVYSSEEEAIKSLDTGAEDDGSISFLKEQAWKMEFQTDKAIIKEVYESIPTSGTWQVAPGDYHSSVATAGGKVQFVIRNLTSGRQVSKGEVIMAISGSGLSTKNLNAEVQKAKAVFDQAQAEYNRKKELYEAQIIPKSEWEQVEQKYLIAKENYQSLSKNYSGRGKQITAPFSGYIKSISVKNGDFVSEGDELFVLTDSRSSVLEVQVSSQYTNALRNIQDIWYQTENNVWSNLQQNKGSVLSVEKNVSAQKPMLSVFARVNEAVNMPEGSFTEVNIAVGKPEAGVVIPVSALLEDYGNYSVIVQLSGESFERRNIIPGRRNGNEVEIKKGLNADEVVVTRGAYQVKMASMSGQAPAHGHAH